MVQVSFIITNEFNCILFTTIKEYSALIFIIKCNIALTMNVRTNEAEYRRTVYFFVAYKSAHILI